MKPLAKTLCLAFLLSCFGFAGSHAGWIENGVPLTHQWGAMGSGVIAPDGSSGAIIAYQVCHDGGGHIIAQHVDSLGVVLWGEGGIEVCTATGDQQSPQIISDGAGGAIVTWQDSRSGNLDIYAQRVDASGTVQWIADGLALCTATGDQQSPQITSDGAGGAIVAWQDYRSGNYEIHAQRVNASGAVLWTTDGVALCTVPGFELLDAQITSDGAGGAIVTWQDNRIWFSYDIYAQRVNASGAVQWTANGVALCTATGFQSVPTIVSDGSSGAIVTWQDSRSGNLDIYAQRVNGLGAVQWASDGVVVCAAMYHQVYPAITSDGGGGAILTWGDGRSGNYDIYAQRMDASGAIQWASDGVALCTATGDQESPRITSDGTGGAIVMWAGISAQRVNASGAVQWTADGVAVCAAAGDGYPMIISDGAGGAIVTWGASKGSNYDIYAQRVDASGAVRWAGNGAPICMATGNQWYPMIISDDAGGAIVTWYEYRSGNADIFTQRVNASGAIQWASDGVALCSATGDQVSPMIISDGAGGAIVMWRDGRSGNYDIYAQRVNASGAIQWASDGVALCTLTEDQESPQITTDGGGGAIVTWSDRRNYYYDIYAQRVNAQGAVLWTIDGVALCAAGYEYSPTIISDGAGGAIVAWEDYRGSDYDIYAQRVNSLGAVQWATDGVALCTATQGQYSPKITSDGAGGAIVTWVDSRSGGGKVYARWVTASGSVEWTTNGIALCAATGDQLDPTIASDGAGGAIVTWEDFRSGDWDIYAQRVSWAGTCAWTAAGVSLCTATGIQEYPAIISDGANGAIVTWQDGNYDIFAQRVNASGAVQWTGNGVALCTPTGNRMYPTVTSDGAGGAIIAWQDNRCGASIHAQRIRGSGEIVATTLQNYSAALEGASIRIGWALSEIDKGARFSILRASMPDWEYIELEGATITQDGLSFTLTDTGCLPGSTYKYRVECEVVGTARRVLFETDAITIPALPVTLYQNHPNPFNPQTVIRFYLPEAQQIFLDVYNVAGQRVARLVESRKEKGYHEVIWDGRNSSGINCSSGIYFSRLKAGKSTISRKMVIMR